MRRPRGLLPGLILAALLGTATGLAHVRLHSGNPSTPLSWTTPSGVSIVINSTGSDDILDGSHLTALRTAIDAWNDIPGTSVHLAENASPAQMARTDWQSDDIHLVWFDEDDSSGFFPSGSAIVALTPVWFYVSSGQIIDADVLFNGDGFLFTTSDVPGHFDVQDVGTHEIGHLLGLDHTGWAGASLYPYVSPSVILHRSPSLDEVAGMRHAYPSSAHASIHGSVRRSEGGQVRGAHVVARAASGRTAAATLSDSWGSFVLRGLDPGTYTLYAHPLAGPVTAANLQAGHTIETDFDATIGGSVSVAAGQSASFGDLTVDPLGGIYLGRLGAAAPRRVVAGETTVVALSGSGLDGSATLSVPDPSLTATPIGWNGSFVVFSVEVPAHAAPGHVDVAVQGPAGRSILPAALEVTPPDPTVTLVSPALGSLSGGTLVTLGGTGFRPGARVIIGERIYRDGEPQGATVLDESTLQLTTAATPEGVFDVVVMDSTGVEGRKTSGFEFTPVPGITAVFPAAGSFSGGTEMAISGVDLLDGLTVTIDGVTQPGLTWVDSTLVRVTTEPGAVGGPYLLRVTNPGGLVADAAFSYAPGPDPALAAISPAAGPQAGGTQVTLTGSGFLPTTTVVFGADPLTGEGGVEAEGVTLVDSSTIEAVAPAHGSGTVAVVVRDGLSGQADVLEAGFTYQGSSGGGGGGGCHTEITGGPLEPEALLLGSWWVLLCLLFQYGTVLRTRGRARVG